MRGKEEKEPLELSLLYSGVADADFALLLLPVKKIKKGTKIDVNQRSLLIILLSVIAQNKHSSTVMLEVRSIFLETGLRLPPSLLPCAVARRPPGPVGALVPEEDDGRLVRPQPAAAARVPEELVAHLVVPGRRRHPGAVVVRAALVHERELALGVWAGPVGVGVALGEGGAPAGDVRLGERR